MLQHLTIKNLAIVKTADLQFDQGMIVITGETGAGKSIVLDALNLVLGHRADTQSIQPGADKAEVSAIFDIQKVPDAILWLNNLDLQQSAQECIIRRIIYKNGRSRAFINGTPATSQQLKMLGQYLVQMHGQHKHQMLLQTAEQLRILDTYGKHLALLDGVQKAYYELEALIKKKQKLQQQDGNSDYQLELLRYQIDEIDNLNLRPNEIEELYQLHDRLAHAQTTLNTTQEALTYLDHEESGQASQLIHHAQQSLQALFEKYPELDNIKDCLETVSIQLQEAVSELNHFMQNLEINPVELERITARLDKIHEVARKHKVEPEQVNEHYETLKENLKAILQDATSLEQIDQDIALCQEQYLKQAKRLSKKRLEAAKKLKTEITKHIQHLGMQEAVFEVKLKQAEDSFGPNGSDQISFCISANKGHPAQALNKVASGGELSRISLALELATIQDTCSPTLIFDEVDVGIGGKTGAIVGRYLNQLSLSQQVICITHLPQVAAFGDQHLMVVKTHKKQNTETQINNLNYDERIDEIARMLGGLNISGEARAQAKHLLEKEKLAEV